jgi:tRNA uridine 5-carbamoylmethylation protein Kti12
VKLVLLYGPPAVGKLSVAQALAARTRFRVLHNHLLIDLSHALFSWGEQSRVFARRLREISLDAARVANLSGIILTFVYARDRDTYILGLGDRAEAQGDEVCLIHLTCEPATLEARVTEPSRGAFGKLMTVAGLREKLELLDAPFGRVEGRKSERA